MKLLIQPQDVWLFRDARPFGGGEQTRAASIFPPSPRTIQGALRSALLAQKSSGALDFDAVKRLTDQALIDELGTNVNFGALHVRGPVLAEKNETSGQVVTYFPHPADLVKQERGWALLRPDQNFACLSNWPKAETPGEGLLPLLPPPGKPEKFDTGWLSNEQFTAYLDGSPPGSQSVKTTLFKRHARYGIELDSFGKRPKEGQLYMAEFVRLLPDHGLLIEATGLSLQAAGNLMLGGEARAANYQTTDAGVDIDAPVLPVENGQTRFKLYLATPAIFQGGWVPDAFRNADQSLKLTTTWRNLEVTLIAAAVNRAQVSGGRDITVADTQRHLHRAVPAGSVYYFESPATPGEIVQALHGKMCQTKPGKLGLGWLMLERFEEGNKR